MYLVLERGFQGLTERYDRMLTGCAAPSGDYADGAARHDLLTGYLYGAAPKSFFPQQDTGLIFGVTEGAQDISIPDLARKELQVIQTVMKDPAVQSVASYIGPGGANPAPNQGRMFIALKPEGHRGPHASADQVIARLNEHCGTQVGITLYMQPAQDITIGGRVAKTQYQYTLTDVSLQELDGWAPRVVRA